MDNRTFLQIEMARSDWQTVLAMLDTKLGHMTASEKEVFNKLVGLLRYERIDKWYDSKVAVNVASKEAQELLREHRRLKELEDYLTTQIDKHDGKEDV